MMTKDYTFISIRNPAPDQKKQLKQIARNRNMSLSALFKKEFRIIIENNKKYLQSA